MRREPRPEVVAIGIAKHQLSVDVEPICKGIPRQNPSKPSNLEVFLKKNQPGTKKDMDAEEVTHLLSA